MGDKREAEPLAEGGDNRVGHHSFHLMGHARHGDEDAAFFFKPHTRGGPPPVGNDSADVGYFCLPEVAIDHRALQSFEDLFYIGERSGIDHQFTPEIFAQQWFGDVVGCRAEAAGDEDDRSAAELVVEGLPDIFADMAESRLPTRSIEIADKGGLA